MLVDLKKTEFAPASVQAGSSSRTFNPEVTGAGGKVQSKKQHQQQSYKSGNGVFW